MEHLQNLEWIFGFNGMWLGIVFAYLMNRECFIPGFITFVLGGLNIMLAVSILVVSG